MRLYCLTLECFFMFVASSTEPPSYNVSGSDPADNWFDDQHSADNKEEVDQHWESVRFLLRMTEEYSLRHAGVDSFCDSTQ